MAATTPALLASCLSPYLDYDSPDNTLATLRSEPDAAITLDMCRQSCLEWDGNSTRHHGDRLCIVSTFRESDGTCWLKAPKLPADASSPDYSLPATLPFLAPRAGFHTSLCRYPSARTTTTPPPPPPVVCPDALTPSTLPDLFDLVGDAVGTTALTADGLAQLYNMNLTAGISAALDSSDCPLGPDCEAEAYLKCGAACVASTLCQGVLAVIASPTEAQCILLGPDVEFAQPQPFDAAYWGQAEKQELLAEDFEIGSNCDNSATYNGLADNRCPVCIGVLCEDEGGFNFPIEGVLGCAQVTPSIDDEICWCSRDCGTSITPPCCRGWRSACESELVTGKLMVRINPQCVITTPAPTTPPVVGACQDLFVDSDAPRRAFRGRKQIDARELQALGFEESVLGCAALCAQEPPHKRGDCAIVVWDHEQRRCFLKTQRATELVARQGFDTCTLPGAPEAQAGEDSAAGGGGVALPVAGVAALLAVGVAVAAYRRRGAASVELEWE